jgi:hypothetical protein
MIFWGCNLKISSRKSITLLNIYLLQLQKVLVLGLYRFLQFCKRCGLFFSMWNIKVSLLCRFPQLDIIYALFSSFSYSEKHIRIYEIQMLRKMQLSVLSLTWKHYCRAIEWIAASQQNACWVIILWIIGLDLEGNAERAHQSKESIVAKDFFKRKW